MPQPWPLVPSAPENIKQQVSMNAEWYAENYTKLLPRYMDLIAA